MRMETHSILLKEAVFEEWMNLKEFLGFSDSSNFAAHILQNYKDLHNITDNDILPKKSGRGEEESYVNGVRIKKEFIDGESNSCDSAETFSGTASPDPGYQSQMKDIRPRKKQLRSSWGLESVVQRLHQAKGESRDDDGWIQDGEASYLSYDDGVRRLPLLDRIKQEQPSDEEGRYSSPKIIPDSARSLSNQTQQELGHDLHDANSAYTLRKLLEKPSVNASAELRLNAAELKERGVVINPAISYELDRNLPVHVPTGDSSTSAKDRESKGNRPPASFALESLIRMALLAKEDGEGSSSVLKETGDSSKSNKELLENQGFNVGSFQKFLFQIPQAFRDSSSLGLRGSATRSMTDAPSLKNILRGREADGDKPEEASASPMADMEHQASENSFGVASAAYALQHLAQMQDPHQGISKAKTASPRIPKVLHQIRHKHDKQRRRHRSGSRNKCNISQLPTVKYLLEKKREGLPLSKYRVRLKGRKDADMRNKAHHSSGDHGHKGRRKGLQDSPVKRNSRKRSGASRRQPGKLPKLLPKPSAVASPPPPAIDISTSASQMMKLIAEQENAPSANSSGSIKSAKPPHLKRGAAVSPHLKTASSPSLNNSASEVMKLLASKNQENKMRLSDPTASIPLKPTTPPGPLRPPPTNQLPDTTPSPHPPPHPHPPPPPSYEHPPKLDNFGKSTIGAADIMKQLANSHSQNTPHRLQYPLSLMFASPPAADSSSAFSLMKQLITKGSS